MILYSTATKSYKQSTCDPGKGLSSGKHPAEWILIILNIILVEYLEM